jgi:hypothetical protein
MVDCEHGAIDENHLLHNYWAKGSLSEQFSSIYTNFFYLVDAYL